MSLKSSILNLQSSILPRSTPWLNLPSLLFPSHCISCAQQGPYLCKTCKKKLIPHPEICPVCHRFSADYATCLDCKSSNKDRYLEGIIIPFSYGDEIKKLILRLKYWHKKDVTDFLVDRLILALQANAKVSSHFPSLIREGFGVGLSTANPPFLIPNSSFLISYVPSHRYRKFFVKGYNQSELLAKTLAKKLWLPCSQIVQKTKYTKSQAGLKRSDRLKNLKNVFSLKQNILNGDETILLIDDVTTTWSTLNQIAGTIKQTYPKVKIWGLVIARHNW